MGKLANPLPLFVGLDGSLLTGGQVYIGEAGKNPETHPVVVYWDQLMQLPAAQPIETIGGYPSRAGTPSNIYGQSNDYSMTVRDNKGRLVLSCLNSAGIFSNTNDVLITPVQFGAVGDGVTDDTAAVQAAINASYGKTLFFPAGTYLCNSLSVTGNISFRGESGSVLKYAAAGTSYLLSITGTSVSFSSEGMTYDGNCSAHSGLTYSVRFAAVGTASAPARLSLVDNTFINGDYADVTIGTDFLFSTVEIVNIHRNRFLGGKEGTSTLDTRYLNISSGVALDITDNYFDFLATPTVYGRAGVIFWVSGHAGTGSRGNISNNILVNVGRSSASGNGVLGAIDGYYGATDVSIVGNTLVTPWGRGIQVKSNANNVVIVGNNITGLGDLTGGVSVDSQITVNRSTTTDIGGQWLISGNSCVNSGWNGISVSAANIDYSAIGPNVAIIGNIISNPVWRGIGLYYGKVAAINDNIINGGCNSGGIYLTNIIDTISIIGNTCKGLSAPDLFISGPPAGIVSVADNRFLSATPYLYSGSDNGNVQFSNNSTAVASSINAYPVLTTALGAQLDFVTGSPNAIVNTASLSAGTYDIVYEGDCTAGAGGIWCGLIGTTLVTSYMRVTTQLWNGTTLVQSNQALVSSGTPAPNVIFYTGAATHYRITVSIVVTTGGKLSLHANQYVPNAATSSIYQGANMKITRIA